MGVAKLSAINLSYEPESLNRQTFATDQERNAGQVQVTTIGVTGQSQATSTTGAVDDMYCNFVVCISCC